MTDTKKYIDSGVSERLINQDTPPLTSCEVKGRLFQFRNPKGIWGEIFEAKDTKVCQMYIKENIEKIEKMLNSQEWKKTKEDENYEKALQEAIRQIESMEVWELKAQGNKIMKKKVGKYNVKKS